MAHDVFVSYSSRDQATAVAVVHGLEAAGIRCWLAPRDIRAGQVWAEAIVEALNSARAFVLVFSSHANRSSHIANELDAAIRKGAIVVPFRIENVMPEGAMEYHLRTRHWLDAFSPDQARHLTELVATVRSVLSSPAAAGPATEFGQPPAAPPPASKSRPAIATTDSAFHLKVPKPGPIPPGARKVIAAIVVVAAASMIVSRLLRAPSEVAGVAFDVREKTASSDFRTTVTTTSIQFFESARGVPAYGSRPYRNRFPATQARYINTEVQLHLDRPGRYLSVPMACTIYDRGDGVTATFTLESRIGPDATDWQSASGWGAEKPGSWKPGKYRVDCRYGDKLVARGRFEVIS